MFWIDRADGEGSPERDHGLVNGDKEGAAETTAEGMSQIKMMKIWLKIKSKFATTSDLVNYVFLFIMNF